MNKIYQVFKIHARNSAEMMSTYSILCIHSLSRYAKYPNKNYMSH